MTDKGSRWCPLGADEATALEVELRRELPNGHQLHGRVFRAVARHQEEPDDVAFEVEGAGLCIVHLTWQQETDARWPHTTFVEALPEEP